MTHDELRARCAAWIGKNDLSSGDDIDTELCAALESLCREMIAVGLESAAVIAGDGGFISDTSAEARFGKECAGAIRREAQRVKEGKS